MPPVAKPGQPPTPAAAAPDPLSDPVNKEKVEIAKEFAFHLAKGIKNIGIYRHNTSKYPEFLAKGLEAVTRFTEKHGPMSLKIESDCFSMFKEPVFQAESASDNLPYKFYRDGIRQLIFRPELSIDELVAFVMIALSDAQRGSEDVLSQLWKANLEHVEYVVVEGFAIGEMSEEEVQVEVDEVVSYLYGRLRSTSDDFLRFARVQAEDLDAKIEGVEQVRGAVVSGTPATPEHKKQLQEQLLAEDGKVFGRVMQILFGTLESGALTDVDLMKDLLAQLLDAELLQEDFAGIGQMVTRLTNLSHDPGRAATGRPLFDFFAAKMGEEQRLRQIGEVVKRTGVKHAAEIQRYLAILPPGALGPLLDVLDALEVPETRKMFLESIAQLAHESPAPIIQRLDSERSQMVRDMLIVIERCDYPDKIKYFGTVLQNRNPAVRIEALGILAKSRTEQARKFVIQALQDQSPQVRVQAARGLAAGAPDRAITEIMRIVRAPDFEKRDLKEREGFFLALGQTHMPGALAYFAELLTHKSLLGRRKVTEEKILSLAGLGAMGGVPAFKAVQAVAEDKSNDPEVLTAARKAMFYLRKELAGEKSAPTE